MIATTILLNIGFTFGAFFGMNCYPIARRFFRIHFLFEALKQRAFAWSMPIQATQTAMLISTITYEAHIQIFSPFSSLYQQPSEKDVDADSMILQIMNGKSSAAKM